ncbi:PTS mannose/fructose/sorbose/N-acetylgalactosamine transporter subunit IIC [Liquorilactobacillus mali]|uniref:PTS mannose/fructose/sorbose/N-acetylgalactosamine transporter subunit IIC n=1 Tax=Liquorilactobacillus mali TaxID=1618 RepID=UPI002952A6E2|nr:PTS sugar transporter subunit IIC [Liquorilactobacillus mali]MDV7758743.1 PTS sugar transporter subunit IIC [Liquorilactobacillus mali]
MHFTILQIILLTLLAFIKHVDYYGIPMLFVNYPVFWGLFTGILMGDVKTGLLVGGTVQLMSLGVAGFGGSSVPDYGTTAIIATAFGVALGKNAGLAIGLPVGMLGVQLDVIVKILNGFVVKKAQSYANKKEFKRMNSIIWVSPILFGLSAAIPVFISVTLGQSAVNFLLDSMPQWFMGGLTIAGKMLPAVGIAMLLNYMPTGKLVNYLLIGFFLAAFLKVPIIGAAIVGFSLAFMAYKHAEEKDKLKATSANNAVDSGVGEDE